MRKFALDARGSGAVVRCGLPQHVSCPVPLWWPAGHFAKTRHPPALAAVWGIAAIFPCWWAAVDQLSLALNYAVGGYDVVGWHLFNLVVHFLNTTLGFRDRRCALPNTAVRGRQSGPDAVGCLRRGGIVDVDPLVTESVTYVLQRTRTADWRCFSCGPCTVSFADESPHKVVWFAAAIMACTLDGTKEVMVVTPLLVPTYDSIFVLAHGVPPWANVRELYSGLAASWSYSRPALTTNLKIKVRSHRWCLVALELF